MVDWSLLTDPVKFTRACWPQLNLYDRQVDILYSVQDNDETIVPAGNMLGKDFIAGICTLWFFCSRSPCRIVTSSAGQKQLENVLWGEIKRFISISQIPLPIEAQFQLIRQLDAKGNVVPLSYVIGIVTIKPENLQGHHLDRRGRPRTLWIADEASGISSEYYDAADTWTHRKLVIGNPLPCTNFFYKGVKEGDLKATGNGHYYRKIIKIKASDSPNVRLAEMQRAKGKEPTHEVIIPGVLPYDDYLKRRAMWDPIRQCIGLDAEFYEGAEVLLYPPDWLNRAEEIARRLPSNRRAQVMGVDAAEGGDSSVWTIIDDMGILYQESRKTHDTAQITAYTIKLMKEWDVTPENVLFDRGGGGKQHVDRLRLQGYEVRSIGFGEVASDPHKYKRMRTSWQKREAAERSYTYKNRRAEMYGLLRYELLDPIHQEVDNNGEWVSGGFGIPSHLTELRRQLAPIPLLYDPEGRLYLPPKDPRISLRDRQEIRQPREISLRELLGCSPDEADSLVLAVFGLFSKPAKKVLGVW